VGHEDGRGGEGGGAGANDLVSCPVATAEIAEEARQRIRQPAEP
jgi:hypothetical protein